MAKVISRTSSGRKKLRLGSSRKASTSVYNGMNSGCRTMLSRWATVRISAKGNGPGPARRGYG